MKSPITKNGAAAGAALAKNGYKVVPTSNSLLAELIHSTGTHIDESSFSDPEMNAEFTSSDIISGIDKKELDISLNKVANIVRNEISFIKNTVVSAISEYSDSVVKESDMYMEKDPTSDFTIVKVGTSLVDNSPMLFDEVSKYVTKATSNIFDARISLPELTGSDVYDKLASISKNYGINVELLTSMYTEGDLAEIWAVYFTDIYPDKTEYVRMYGSVEIEKLLIIYLLSKYLKVNVLEGVKTRLNIYNEVMNEIIKRTATTINFLYNNLKSGEEKGKLIITKNIDERVVYVNEALYVEFLKENDLVILYGTLVDDIPGRAVSVRNNSFMKLIIENKELLLENWNKYVKLTSLETAVKNDRTLRRVYVSVYRNMVRALPETLVTSLGVDYVNGTIVKVEQCIRAKGKSELINTISIAEEVIPGILFAATNAKKYLKSMDSYHALDENLTAKECASLATSDLVAVYFVGMLTVSKT